MTEPYFGCLCDPLGLDGMACPKPNGELLCEVNKKAHDAQQCDKCKSNEEETRSDK